MEKPTYEELEERIESLENNIEQYKRKEKIWNKNERRYQTLMETVPVGIWHADPDGNDGFFNSWLMKITGLTPECVQTRGWISALHPDDKERVYAQWSNFVQGKSSFNSVYRFKRPDGQVRWVIGKAAPVLDQDHDLIGFIGTLTDISDLKQLEAEFTKANDMLEERVRDRTAELLKINNQLKNEIIVRKQAEESLEINQEVLLKNEKMLKDAHRIALLGYWDIDFESGEITWSDQLFRLLGYKPGKVSPSQSLLLEHVHYEDKADFLISAFDKIGEIDFRFIRTDNEQRFGRLLNKIVIDGEGGLIRMFGIFQDITDRKRTKADLQYARQAADDAAKAKSDILDTMSHEIQTPLNEIVTTTALLINAELTPAEQQYVEIIRSSGETLLTIINNILDYSKIESDKIKSGKIKSDKIELEDQTF